MNLQQIFIIFFLIASGRAIGQNLMLKAADEKKIFVLKVGDKFNYRLKNDSHLYQSKLASYKRDSLFTRSAYVFAVKDIEFISFRPRINKEGIFLSLMAVSAIINAVKYSSTQNVHGSSDKFGIIILAPITIVVLPGVITLLINEGRAEKNFFFGEKEKRWEFIEQR